MRAALACLAVGSLVACGGGGGAAPGPRQPVGPAIDPATAQQGASDLITEIYDTLGRGNKDSVFTLLEDSLIVFGPRGGDMMGTRADALVALGQVIDPKAKKNLAITSDKIDVIPGPGGHSAIAFDPAILNGQPHTILAVLDNTNDLWLVGTVSIAQTPTEAQLKAELAKDAVVPPAATGIRKLDPAARPAVEKFQRGLLDQASWGEELASHQDAIVIGPAGGEVARGKQAIRALWRKRVDTKTRAAIAGEITAAVTGDGQLAWVSAPITRVEGEGTQPLPLRAFAVYRRVGGDWKLLALQESIAFSAPGAGASFKRFLPPKPVEPKAPEVIAARPKDGGGGKGKPELAAAEPKRKAKLEVEEAPRKKEKDPEKKDPEKKDPEKKVTAKEARADEAVAADEAPRRKKKKRSFFGSDDDGADSPKKKEREKEPERKVTAKETKADEVDESPRRKRKKRSFGRSDDESAVEESPRSESPRTKKQKLAKSEDAEAESPKKKGKHKAEADEESPRRQKLAKSEDAEAESPRKKKAKSRAKSEDTEEESPKKKKVAKAEAKAEAEPEAEPESPKKKKSKAKAKSEDAEEESPKKKVAKAEAEPEAEPKAESPKKKKKLAKTEEAEAPKKKAKAEDAEEAPKKKSKAKAEDEATEETPKKKPRAKTEDADEAPKKKKKPAAEAEDEVEVID